MSSKVKSGSSLHPTYAENDRDYTNQTLSVVCPPRNEMRSRLEANGRSTRTLSKWRSEKSNSALAQQLRRPREQ